VAALKTAEEQAEKGEAKKEEAVTHRLRQTEKSEQRAHSKTHKRVYEVTY